MQWPIFTISLKDAHDRREALLAQCDTLYPSIMSQYDGLRLPTDCWPRLFDGRCATCRLG